jgi:formylglycine-generating enzyme
MFVGAGVERGIQAEPPLAGMRWIPGGTFGMGGAEQSYSEEAPVHTVAVDSFWVNERTVANAEFAAFVQATGYRRTVAEQASDPALYPGAQPKLLTLGSAVFFMPAGRVNMRRDPRRARVHSTKEQMS